MIDERTRRRYLEVMGIQVWLSRGEESGKHPSLAFEAGDLLQGHERAAVPSAPAGNAAERWKPQREAERGSEVAPVRKGAPVPEDRGEAPACWHSLEAEVAVCRACPLHETRTQTVFGVGDHGASWMVVGEAPGASEDQKGEPFVGPAGRLLTEMLRAIGLRREEVFITNILKCRPPNNRDPKPEEVESCDIFLRRQVALLKPRIILAVGRIAAQKLLKTDTPVGKLRGRVHRYGGIPVVVVYHPAYLLRSLMEKHKAWDDLCFALAVYQGDASRVE